VNREPGQRPRLFCFEDKWGRYIPIYAAGAKVGCFLSRRDPAVYKQEKAGSVISTKEAKP